MFVLVPSTDTTDPPSGCGTSRKEFALLTSLEPPVGILIPFFPLPLTSAAICLLLMSTSYCSVATNICSRTFSSLKTSHRFLKNPGSSLGVDGTLGFGLGGLDHELRTAPPGAVPEKLDGGLLD
eukprot:CAMPEP_0184369760 /NCGR_PEP_ID=MMETSP1089-20130417/162424_1 /TAXON_ID=38269 ORGANISM="Gloeochaete wittrockiana, Strain SAG46.84" /NCGR_SAMPLE_ID=MMETSP1089 /ASSEMBLY_ACC=CAM_ASM_000445 /LENGTH=123 /DNA_ID=CAMNT_0026712251 /DNA_START=1616 /DNA_END=1987 /DNA_ORIENTATION=+